MVSLRRLCPFVCIALLLFSFGLNAQETLSFKAQEASARTHSMLSTQFTDYELWELPTEVHHQLVALSMGQEEVAFEMALPNTPQAIPFQLYVHDLRASNFRSLRYRDGKTIAVPSGPVTNFRGYRNNKPAQRTAVTIDPNFILANWIEGKSVRYVEPLWRFQPDAPRDLYVTYLIKDIIPREGACGTEHLPAAKLGKQYQQPTNAPTKLVGECKVVDIALAADFLMFQEFGSVGSVESFMFGVLGDVQTNYDDEFADELRYEVLTTFVADCSSCDPWTSSTGAGTLLDDFVNWGNNGGFGTTAYDVASLWTDRNLAGSTIGVAYLEAVCFSLRYNVLQNFTTSSEQLRVLWAHELGHNFGATHDGSSSFTIMAPSVNTSTQWSSQSRSQINSYIQFADCLDICEGSTPPDAAITSPESFYCVGSIVPLFDASTGDPDSWFWEMPGANPSTSSERHPRVTFDTPGSYTVTLFADNNNGGDIATYTIEVGDFNGATRYVEYENFEQGFGAWDIIDSDGRYPWTLAETGGNAGNFAPFVNNYDYRNGQGQVDALLSPPFDLSLESNITLGLQYAYRQYTNGAADRLRIYGSTDGGATFPDLLFNAAGAALATGSPTANPFFPSSESDWCDPLGGCIEIDLSAYAGEESVVFRIENVTAFGNNLFVDNVYLSANCEVPEPPEPDFIYNPEFGCSPMEVSFLDITEGVVDFREWHFPGGDPEFSNDPEVTVTYFEPGIYEVSLYVENAAGSNSLVINEAIQVVGQPNVDFTYIQDGNIFTFTADTDPEVFDLYWDFGDGNFNNDNDLEVTHTYAGPGTYVVELEVFNGCETNTVTQVIVIEPDLTADFTALPLSGCAPLMVDFFADGEGEGYSYDWDFPGGTPSSSTEQNPSVTYPDGGNYDVSLTVMRNGETLSNTETAYITVNDAPTASFTYSLAPGEAGPTITNTSMGADSYFWEFGDGRTSTDETPIILYDEAGTYTISLTTTNECGEDSFSETISIIFPITPDFTADVNSGCSPLTVSFTAIPADAELSYEWDFPGGEPNSSTEINPTISYPVAGSYDVSLSITNAAGTETTTLFDYIVVNDVPNAAFEVVTTPGSLTVQLDNQSTNADSYLYDFGDGNTASDNPDSYTYNEAGSYTISLTATNECGDATITQDITLILPVTPGFTASTTSGCDPLAVTFTAEPQVEGQTYVWAFPGGEPATSTDANPTILYATPGSYDVSLSITNAAGTETTTATDYILVGAGPEASFSSMNELGTGNVQFTSASGDATTYAWDFGDGNSSTEANPSHLYEMEGTYTVSLTTTNDCGSSSSEQTISIVFPPSATILTDVSEGCAPTTVTYTADPAREDYTYSWAFPGGEPATATTASVDVTYTEAGSYTATLTATNAAGSTHSELTTPVLVGEAPMAMILTDYTIGERSASFTASASGAFAEDSAYQWAFGDGATDSGSMVSHTYATDGTYTVSLTVAGPCGDITVSESLVVVTPPTAGFTANVTSGCLPLRVNFTAEDQREGLSYQWSFAGGSPNNSTIANPVVTYTEAGTYTVGLTVMNAAGNATVMETEYIVVGDRPIASFTSENELGLLDVNFTAAASTATNWAWDFGDGNTATGQDISYTYATDGEYAVRLIASNDCGADTSFQSITLLLPPTADIQASATSICENEVMELLALPTGAEYSYEWTLEGANPASSTAANVQLSYANAGTYTIMLTVTNAAGSNTTTTNITVNAAPTVGYTFTTNGLGADFINTSSGAMDYSWNFADLGNSSEPNPSFTFPSTGSYPVSLTATNNCGQVSTVDTVVIEGQTPTVRFDVSNNIGCGPLAVDFNNTSTGGESWLWSFPGGEPLTSTEEHPSVSYTNPGVYTVTLVASNAFGNSSYSREAIVTVLEPTVADYSYDLEVTTATFTDVSSQANMLEWQFPDGSSSNMANPSYTFPGNGTYIVTLIASGPCNSDTVAQEIIIDGPLPEVMISNNQEKGCAPFTVQFTDASTAGPTAWDWTFTGGEPASSNAANPEVTYTEAGNYDVSLTVTNAYGSSTQSWTALVEVEEAPQLIDIQEGTFDGLTYGFLTNPSNPQWDYRWTLPDSSTQDSIAAIYTFTETGTFPISVAVSNDCGTTILTDEIAIFIDLVDSPDWAQHLQLYPNPTAGDLQVRASGWPIAGQLKVRLYNPLGQLIRQEDLNLTSGNWQHSLDLNNLPAGTYQLQFLWDNRWWTAKISKI